VNLSPKLIQVALVPPPQPMLEQQALRLLFSDLSLPRQLPVFNSMPDGGATLSNPALQRQVVIAPGVRQVQFNVELTAAKAVEEVVDVLAKTQARFPVDQYLGFTLTIVSHVPVTGETAMELFDRSVLRDPAALNELGPGRLAAGIRVILGGAGQTFVTLEPLIGDPGKLFVQIMQTGNGPFGFAEVTPRIDAMLRYHDNQVRQFVGRLL